MFVLKAVRAEWVLDDDVDDPEDARSFVIPTEEQPPPRYFTGKMLGPWPEYLRDRSRSQALEKSAAQQLRSAFNERFELLMWSLEAA